MAQVSREFKFLHPDTSVQSHTMDKGEDKPAGRKFYHNQIPKAHRFVGDNDYLEPLQFKPLTGRGGGILQRR